MNTTTIKSTQVRRPRLHEFPTPGENFRFRHQAASSTRATWLAYSPGVAAASRPISKTRSRLSVYRSRQPGRSSHSRGARVWGNRARSPPKPVMEGKAVLFRNSAGIDVFASKSSSAIHEVGRGDCRPRAHGGCLWGGVAVPAPSTRGHQAQNASSSRGRGAGASNCAAHENFPFPADQHAPRSLSVQPSSTGCKLSQGHQKITMWSAAAGPRALGLRETAARLGLIARTLG